jgi:hypothetical protein
MITSDRPGLGASDFQPTPAHRGLAGRHRGPRRTTCHMRACRDARPAGQEPNSARGEAPERGEHRRPSGRTGIYPLEMATSWQLGQSYVITCGARAGRVRTTHLTWHLIIGYSVDNSHRNAQRNQVCRIGQRVTVRVLPRPAAEQAGNRAAAKPLPVAGAQVADWREGHDPADGRPRDRARGPGRVLREKVAPRRPQGQVTARRMPGEQQPTWVAGAGGRRGHEGWQPVHGGRNVIESPRPATFSLTYTAVLRHAYRIPSGREGRRHGPRVPAVVRYLPEPAMKHNDQRPATPAKRSPGPAPAGQPDVGDVVRARAVADHGVRRRRRPGENFSRVHGVHSGTSQHVMPADHPDSQPPRA